MPAKKITPPVEPVEAIVPPAEPVAPVAPAPLPPAPVAPYTPPQPLPAGNGKPGMVQAIAIMTLINGIISILYGLSWTAGLLPTIICWPIGAYPIVLGILELVYAAKLLGSSPQGVKPAQSIAIMEICSILFGNVFALIGGILALVFYSNDDVRAYFARING
jgi:hypothetical protein